MQPEVQSALITAVLAAVTGVIVAIIGAIFSYRANQESAKASNLMLEMKNQLLSFENVFVDRLNGRYIRKPDLPDDYPMTKAEGRKIEEKVDCAAETFETYRQTMHDRFQEIHKHINSSAKGHSA